MARLRVSVPLVLVFGCIGYPGPRSVTNQDPSVKIPAIRRAVAAGDRSVVPQLVSDLESDDPAVRFYAIDGLERLTGLTFGFVWTEDVGRRKPAVERWQGWLRGEPQAATQPATRPAQPTTPPA